MALGKPVVAFDVGGIGEELGKCGVLISAGDIGAMAHAVVTLLADEPRRRALGETAAARVEQFDSSVIQQRILQSVNALLNSQHD